MTKTWHGVSVTLILLEKPSQILHMAKESQGKPSQECKSHMGQQKTWKKQAGENRCGNQACHILCGIWGP